MFERVCSERSSHTGAFEFETSKGKESEERERISCKRGKMKVKMRQ